VYVSGSRSDVGCDQSSPEIPGTLPVPSLQRNLCNLLMSVKQQSLNTISAFAFGLSSFCRWHLARSLSAAPHRLRYRQPCERYGRSPLIGRAWIDCVACRCGGQSVWGPPWMDAKRLVRSGRGMPETSWSARSTCVSPAAARANRTRWAVQALCYWCRALIVNIGCRSGRRGGRQHCCWDAQILWRIRALGTLRSSVGVRSDRLGQLHRLAQRQFH